MNTLSFENIDDIKAEEKRLYEEYKNKLSQLKKAQKNKDTSGQVFTKGLLPIYLLHILNESPSNGNDISNKIYKKTNGLWSPSTGGIYPLLKRLENEGLVSGEWDDPNKKFQKIYSLTPTGINEYLKRKEILKPRIEEALMVFKIIYTDLYK